MSNSATSAFSSRAADLGPAMQVDRDFSQFFGAGVTRASPEQPAFTGKPASPPEVKVVDRFQRPGNGVPESQTDKSGQQTFSDGTSVAISGTDGPNIRTGALSGRFVTKQVSAQIPLTGAGAFSAVADLGWKPGSNAAVTGVALGFSNKDVTARLSVAHERPVLEPGASARVIRGDLSVGKNPTLALTVIHTVQKAGADAVDIRPSITIEQDAARVTASGRLLIKEGASNNAWGARLAASLNNNQFEAFMRVDQELLGPGTAVQGGVTIRF